MGLWPGRHVFRRELGGGNYLCEPTWPGSSFACIGLSRFEMVSFPAFVGGPALGLRSRGPASYLSLETKRPPSRHAEPARGVTYRIAPLAVFRQPYRANERGPPRRAASSSGKESGLPGSSAKYPNKTVAGLIKVAVVLLLSVPLFIPMVIFHPLVMTFDRHRRRFHTWVQMQWMKLSLRAVNIPVQVLNREKLPPRGKATVYVANHTSFLDIFAMAFLGRLVKYLSKSEIFRMPVVGWSMFLTGNIGVKRMNRRGQVEAYQGMISALKHGVSLAIYPEGTRSVTGKMRPFRSGAFRAAKKAGVLVVPVTIRNAIDIMPPNTWSPLKAATKPIQLVVHDYIDSNEHTIDEMQQYCFNKVSGGLQGN